MLLIKIIILLKFMQYIIKILNKDFILFIYYLHEIKNIHLISHYFPNNTFKKIEFNYHCFKDLIIIIYILNNVLNNSKKKLIIYIIFYLY